MSEKLSNTQRAIGLAALIAFHAGCGYVFPPDDTGIALDAGAGAGDAAATSQLREDTCTYWPLDPGPSCGEQIYGGAKACLEALVPCAEHALLGTGYCWEGADERCDPSCLPECADAPP